MDVEKLLAEATAWRNEEIDDPKTEPVSARVVSLVARLADALEVATSEPLMVDDEDRLMAWLESATKSRIERVVEHGRQVLIARAGGTE